MHINKLILIVLVLLALAFSFSVLIGCGDDDDDDDSSPSPDDDDDNDDNNDDDNDDDTAPGDAWVEPNEVQASALTRLEVSYVVDQTIQKGGKIYISFGPAVTYMKDCRMRTDTEKPCGVIRVTTTASGITLSLSSNYDGPVPGVRLAEAVITVANGTLNIGDVLTLTYGAEDGLARVQEVAQEAEVTIRVQPTEDTPAEEIANSPVLTVWPLDADTLTAAVKPDEGLLKLSVVDKWGSLVTSFDNSVEVALIEESGTTTDLGSVQMANGLGKISLPTVTPGYYVFECESGDLIARVPWTPGNQRVFFGDIHFHTKLSDSYNAYDPAVSYQYAIDAALIDFVALSDHAENLIFNTQFSQFLIREDIENSWKETKRLNELFNENGIVTLLGFEMTFYKLWYPKDGHHNVYYRIGDGELFTYSPVVEEVEGFWWVEDLWAKLDQDNIEAITIPHHTLYPSGMGCDFAFYDSTYERLVEIYSHHGCSESKTCPNTLYNPDYEPEGRGTVQNALGPMGYRLGFIAGSDNHFGHPGGTGTSDPYFRLPGGLTAVVADELDRDILWTSLHDRSTYGTTGRRIYVNFSINGQRMGSEITDPASVQIQSRVIGTDDIATVEIVKYDATNGWQEIDTQSPGALFWNGSYTDAAFTEDSVYYLRVTQADGHMAWSSPIWVDSSMDGRYPVKGRIVPPHRKHPSFFEETPAEGLLFEGRISFDDF